MLFSRSGSIGLFQKRKIVPHPSPCWKSASLTWRGGVHFFLEKPNRSRWVFRENSKNLARSILAGYSARVLFFGGYLSKQIKSHYFSRGWDEKLWQTLFTHLINGANQINLLIEAIQQRLCDPVFIERLDAAIQRKEDLLMEDDWLVIFIWNTNQY